MNTRESTAPWWQDAVFYQIYPRSFRDSNGDGVGDLRGIIEQLDYLNDGKNNTRSLGIDALWISPFFRSPMRDCGYDISDYKDVDPLFGTIDDARELISACHARGIRVIIDLVLNHTSDQHPWFQASASDPDGDKGDWYLWAPRRPNNWIAMLELKSAWWWDERRQAYYLATFSREQPEVNWRNPAVREAMYDVVRFWLEMGVDGFRLDVINWFIKDDRLRSNPWHFKAVPDMFQKHIYDRNRPETLDICRELREISDKYSNTPDDDKVLVGEVFTDDAEIAASYHGQGNDALHMAFNFEFLWQKWDARAFHDAIQHWYAALPEGAWPNFTLSNHDQPRHYSRYMPAFGTRDYRQRIALARARVAAAMLLTVRGTPFLYYGEEIGMQNVPLKRHEIQDPLGQRLSFLTRDKGRAPMQWDASATAGFCPEDAPPWLPVRPAGTQANVEAQLDDPDSLLGWYRTLIRLRRQEPALRQGQLQMLCDGSKQVLGWRRHMPDETGTRDIVVLLNFANRTTPLPDGQVDTGTVLAGTHRDTGEAAHPAELLPHEVLILGQ